MNKSAGFYGLGWSAGAVAFALWATAGLSTAAQLRPPHRMRPFVYTYAGIAYDRGYVHPGTRASRNFTNRSAVNAAAAPYVITNLDEKFYFATPGIPLGINAAGDIAFADCGDEGCYVAGTSAYVLHDNGTATEVFEGQYGDDVFGAFPYAINNNGDVAGQWYSQYTQSDEHTAHADWTPTRSYDDPVDDGSFALAMNDANMSVGQAIFAGTPCAALFQITTAGGDARPKILLPPKGTSWVGTATGINASGIIVGYEVFGNGNSDGRAVRFFEHGNAVVLPVGAAGVSTSAQAINVHGDIVGNAGGQAYLYKNNRVIYLPRPPGESAGYSGAGAINASDEVVGGIYVPATVGGAAHYTSFLYKNGHSYDLDTLLPANSGWHITGASGINDSGEIIGTGEIGADVDQISMKPTQM